MNVKPLSLRARLAGQVAAHLDFAPAILKVQDAPPSPLPRAVMWLVVAIFVAALTWAAIGKLDIVAVAPGRLVPASMVQIVQPAEAGIVRELLVREGAAVQAGQVLVRMDTQLSAADQRIVENDLALRGLQLRRIDAELAGLPMRKQADDPGDLYEKVDAQYRERRRAYLDGLAQEEAARRKAHEELRAALEIQAKLEQVLPTYRDQEAAFEKLGREGYVNRLQAQDKARERIEKEQDLKAQGHNVESLRHAIAQSEQRIAQLQSTYRKDLQTERMEAEREHARLREESGKHIHRASLLELRAPEAGIVKDLATHTPGTVLSPGTVVMTLVPHTQPLKAEVWLANEDAGWVTPGQATKLKLAAYPFQKYGMVDGKVEHVSPDASEAQARATADKQKSAPDGSQGAFRTLVTLAGPYLEADGKRYALGPGMQVVAEIHLGTRSALEYLLSPIQRTVGEAGRER